jgi:ATP-binding cassette subfamily B (MDR/TAP) protein 9
MQHGLYVRFILDRNSHSEHLDSVGFGYANQRIVRAVRIDTFLSILKQDIGFFDGHTSGELASRLNADCGEMAGDLVRNLDITMTLDVFYFFLCAHQHISALRLGFSVFPSKALFESLV